jgi:NADH dehydrogenase
MILVTGATGFIGQHLVKELVDAQYPVCCLIRPSQRERSFAPGVKVHIVAGDMDDLPALRVALYHATHVIHLASIWDETERDTFESANIQGTHNVIAAMQEVGVRRLITMSSIGAHTHSAYPFMRVKAQVDDIVEASELDYTILESSAVYGRGDNWTETIALALRRFPFFFPIPGDGRTRLQPLFVNDLVRCILACVENDKTARKTYSLGGSQQLAYDDLVSTIMQATHHPRRKRYLRPASVLSWSRFMRSFIGGRSLYTETQIDLLSVDRTTNQDAVSFHFGFTPMRLADSLGYLR